MVEENEILNLDIALNLKTLFAEDSFFNFLPIPFVFPASKLFSSSIFLYRMFCLVARKFTSNWDFDSWFSRRFEFKKLKCPFLKFLFIFLFWSKGSVWWSRQRYKQQEIMFLLVPNSWYALSGSRDNVPKRQGAEILNFDIAYSFEFKKLKTPFTDDSFFNFLFIPFISQHPNFSPSHFSLLSVPWCRILCLIAIKFMRNVTLILIFPPFWIQEIWKPYLTEIHCFSFFSITV